MTSGTKVLRESLIVILFLAALCLLFFHEAFSKTFIFRDTVTFSQPKFQMLYHSYLEARIPLWNPGEFLGFPFMAEPQSAALYPLHLLTFWMDFPVAFRVLIIMHYFLSGLFMYCLLRQLRLRIPSCLFGALAFFGTGYLMSMNGSLNVLMAIPWLPAAAACFLRAMQRNSINWAGAGGMALAMTILVGSPDTTLFIAIVLFAFAFLYRATTSGASRGQSLLYLLFLLVVAGCLSAVQVLPSLELGAMSRKVAGYSFDEASRWSLHPFRLLEFMFPWFFGKIWPQNHFWGQFLLRSSQIPGSFPVNVNWALSIYPGLVVLALAAAYAFKQKNRISIVMGILFLVFILIAMGRYSPLYRLAYHVVPFFESLRYPEKYVLGIAFVMACLSGLGFETLIELKERTELKKLVLASLIVLIAFAIISLSLLALRGIIGNAIHEWLRAEGFPPFSPLIIRHTILRAVLWPSLVALACLVVFLLAYRFNLIRTWLWPAIFLIAVMDIYWTNKAALVWGQPVIYGKEPRASTAIHERAQPEGEKYRIYRDSNLAYQARADLPGNIPYLEKLRRFERDILVPNVPEPQGLEQLSGYNSSQTIRFLKFMKIPDPELIMNLGNVRYVITRNSPTPISQALLASEIFQDQAAGFRILRNRRALPRAFFVDGEKHAANDEEALKMMKLLEPAREVLIENSHGRNRPGNIMRPARIKEYLPEKVRIHLDAPGSGYLVLADSYYPGWQAELNADPVRILQANYIMRAIRVNAGENDIELFYKPCSFRIGTFFSITSLACLIVFLSMNERRKKRSRD